MISKSFEEKLKERQPVADDKVVPLHATHAEAESLLPGFDADYRAASMQSNRPLTRLVLCMGQKGFRPGGKAYYFFQYVHLDSNADFGFDDKGQVLTFRFAGMTPVLITIHGRNLLQIMDYVQLHRMPWLRVADRDFSASDARDEEGQPRAIITRILIADAKTGELVTGG